MRLARWLPLWLPTAAGMRHGLALRQAQEARPRPRTTPPGRERCRGCTPARSGFFPRYIGIADDDRTALLALAHGHPGCAPSAALLPAQTSGMQRLPNRVGAHPRQPVFGPAARAIAPGPPPQSPRRAARAREG